MSTSAPQFQRVPAPVGVRQLCEVAALLLQNAEVNAASKHAVRVVLRSAVNKSCPEYRGNDNKKNAQYVSAAAEAALKGERGGLVADHAVPLSLLLQEVYGKKLTEVGDLVALVERYSMMALITRDEDSKLRERGLAKRMPETWDGKDMLARYQAAGIQLKPLKVRAASATRKVYGNAA